jgi:hypothetical protein
MWGAKLSDLIGTLLFVRSARVITLSGIIVLIVLLFVADQWGHIPVEWMQNNGWLSKEFDANNPLFTLYLFGALGLTTTVSLFLIGSVTIFLIITFMVLAVKAAQNKKSRLINQIKLIEQDMMKLWPREHMNFQTHLKRYWLQWDPVKREQW